MKTEIHNLSCDESHRIFTQACGSYTIEIFENEDYRWLSLGNGIIQSLSSISEPDRVLFPYLQSMLLVLAWKQPPLKLLNLGSGCGTIERFLSKHYPDISVTSVESDINMINIARKYFNIPASQPFIHGSADAFVKTCKTRYELILCDLHDGATHPEYLDDLEFYLDVKNCLSDDGVLVINHIPDGESALLDKLLVIRKVFKWQCLLDFDNYKNIILYISNREPSLDDSYELNERLTRSLKINTSALINRMTFMPPRSG